MLRYGLLAIAYAGMAGLAIGISELFLDRAVWWHPEPWLALDGNVAHAYSGVLGMLLGAIVVVGTRRMVERLGWAQELARALRPFARDLSGLGIIVVAVLSSVGEELLFRGLLQPWVGVWIQALLFGLLHQMPGPSRWAWVGWASVIGLVFGALFALTGSLLGPILAHIVINGFNLNYLQNHDPELPRRGLGGLLGHRSRA
ncbi:MAG: CPBP family intramembrane glutamic endopeptidase [Pseudomonadota bacterium]|nr:MAG: CPBP family intramembrane metalloprotease [Pseudomonadota bacterium]